MGNFRVCRYMYIIMGECFPVLKISNLELQIAPGNTSAQLVFAGVRFLLAGFILLSFLFVTNRKKRTHKQNKRQRCQASSRVWMVSDTFFLRSILVSKTFQKRRQMANNEKPCNRWRTRFTRLIPIFYCQGKPANGKKAVYIYPFFLDDARKENKVSLR
jgi:hypothetical protein